MGHTAISQPKHTNYYLPLTKTHKIIDDVILQKAAEGQIFILEYFMLHYNIGTHHFIGLHFIAFHSTAFSYKPNIRPFVSKKITTCQRFGRCIF